MPIDAETPGSPGWWMQRLWKRLQADQERFRILEAHYVGQPPLAWGSEATKSRFYRFQQTSRTNFAALIVQAMSERIGLRSISTGVEADSDGDPTAWRLVTGNDLDIHFPEAARTAFKFGRAYLAAASPDEDDELSVITAEDPRQMVVETDPSNPRKVLAAFKLFHDDTAGLDIAVLWIPGEKHIAVRARKAAPTPRSNGILGSSEPPKVAFSLSAFEMRPVLEEVPEGEVADDGYYSETFTSRTVPVRELVNRDGVGEYEQHLDLLDRINHMNFMLMVITTLQAFRQRGLKQSDEPGAAKLEERDESGQLIDYNDMFESGPDSLWLLPAGVDVWESQQGDTTGLLAAIKAALLMLSAVTRTPMSMFTPDAATQTAEGAMLQREGLVFKVEEFLRSAGRALATVIALGFEYMNDDTRSDPSKIEVNFLPAERYSLAEKGSATAQAANVLPFESMLEQIWQLSPEQIRQAISQRAADQQQAAIQAALAARAGLPAAPAPAPAPQPVNGGSGARPAEPAA